MRINCEIDGQTYSLVVNADKPLNRILQENVPSFSVKNKCLNSECGNCVVRLNGTSVLSCLIPAFKTNGAVIETFEGFKKTKQYHDIEKAFSDTGNHPCSQCYASKVLLIESIVEQMEKNANVGTEFIIQEMAVNNCSCIEANQLEKIVHAAYENRSKRNGRKS